MATGLDNLRIYGMAESLELEVYSLTKQFPAEEKFRSVDQLRRSSSSVTNNIAESYNKGSVKDKVRILQDIAKSEAEETKRNLLVCLKKGLHSDERLPRGYTDLIKAISGYIKFLKKTYQLANLPTYKLKEGGAALLITMILLTAIMATVLGVAALTLGETGITRLVDDSVKAVFAADAGMEKLFYYTNRLGGDPTNVNFKKSLETLATGFASCPSGETCYFACAPGQGCTADVLKSRGEFGGVQRSFEAAY